MTFVILMVMADFSVISNRASKRGVKVPLARAESQVQPSNKVDRKNGAKHIQKIKNNFFTEDSLRLFSSIIDTSAKQLEGFTYQRKGRDPVELHPFKSSFGLLQKVENQLFKLAHKPLIKSLTMNEKKELTKLRDRARPALSKIVKYELPEGKIDSVPSEYSGSRSRVFDTHLDSSSIPNYQERLKLVENGNLGDVSDTERELLHAASDFNNLKSEDLREALDIPLEQVKGLANKVWFKLNQMLGETNHHKIVNELYKADSDNSVMGTIKSIMDKTLRGSVDIGGARQTLDKMYQEFKHGSHKTLTFSRAKIIAALKFSRIFLQKNEDKQALPESILVKGDKHKLFNISRSKDLPEINQIGNRIQKRIFGYAQAA